jgi:hypothetical protein
VRHTSRVAVIFASALAVAYMLTPQSAAAPAATHETTETVERWERIEIEHVAAPDATPPAREAPNPPPRPKPRPRPSGIPAQRASNELSRGERLLEAGSFPTLRATYRRIGFDAYRDAVLALGGSFFLFDAVERRPLAEIDPRTGAVTSRELREGLSRWPRDVTRHVPRALERGRRRWGERASRVILLPPAHVDAALLGALDTYLRAQGERGDRLVSVDLAYELRDGRLGCEVLALSLPGGTRRSVGLHVDLSGGAAG